MGNGVSTPSGDRRRAGVEEPLENFTSFLTLDWEVQRFPPSLAPTASKRDFSAVTRDALGGPGPCVRSSVEDLLLV